jgi:transcriptional regulator with XRE-family HTH domain
MQPKITLGMKLKALRTKQGLTQMALAKKLTMKQAYLARLESGAEDNPTLATLRRLAKALRCKVSELVD